MSSIYDKTLAAARTGVADMDQTAFEAAGKIAADALRAGGGLVIFFQPGDATRYRLEIGPTSSTTVSNGVPTQVTHSMLPIASTRIGFGTESDMTYEAFGRLRELRPSHAWTAAIWERLLGSIREALQ